jgi:peptidoglycan hydrolase CwlO-like protein
MLKITWKKFLITIAILLLVSFIFKNHSIVKAEEATPTPTPGKTQQAIDLENKIKGLENKISELKGQEKTLSSQIAVMDSQIDLTQARIDSTKEQILELTANIDTTNKKINSLQASLTDLMGLLVKRIVATYQVGSAPSFQVLMSSTSVSNLFTRLNYLKFVQAHDKELIYSTQQAKMDYSNQKTIFEDEKKKVESLKKQLEDYSAQLESQKADKQRLLDETEGSEATYQQLLAQARAEYEQIQGIVSGKGYEEEVGHVNQGDHIATVISGPSCNSSGTHLHFTISRSGNAENPFSYLKSVDHTNDSNGDAFNPSGSWEWPVDPPILLTQGYGDTWYVRTYGFYPFHNGIDIVGSSSVKAVKSGTLFKGSYSGSGGCRLNYVRVHHDEDGLDTFYLHIIYVR